MNLNLLNVMPSVFKYLLFGIVCMALGFWVRGVSGCNPKSDPLQIVSDPTTIERQAIAVHNDTSRSFVEPLYNTQQKTKVVYRQKADSNYAHEVTQKDVVTSVHADKSELSVFTYNTKTNEVSEYKFANPGREFSLIPQDGKIFLKSNDFYLRTLMLNAEAKFNGTEINWIDADKFIGLKSRLEFRDQLELEIGAKHNLKNSISLQNIEFNLQLNYTLIK